MKLYIVQYTFSHGLWLRPFYKRVWAESSDEAEKPFKNNPNIDLTGPTRETRPKPGEKPGELIE